MKARASFVFWLGVMVALGCVAQEQAILLLKVLGKWG